MEHFLVHLFIIHNNKQQSVYDVLYIVFSLYPIVFKPLRSGREHSSRLSIIYHLYNIEMMVMEHQYHLTYVSCFSNLKNNERIDLVYFEMVG